MTTTGWRIDEATKWLANVEVPDADRVRYTAAEFASQQWPPCPVCGTTVEVDQIYVTLNEADQRRHGDTYIPGMWECPRGCDPITGERFHWSREMGYDAARGHFFRCSCGVDERGMDRDEFVRLVDAHQPKAHGWQG